jgi:hypothetical protein
MYIDKKYRKYQKYDIMFLTTKTKYQEVLPMGNSITQKLKYRKSVIKFSFK